MNYEFSTTIRPGPGALVTLGDVAVPPSVTVTVEFGASTDAERPTLAARYEMRDGVPVCADLAVSSASGHVGVTQDLLNVFKLDGLGRHAFLKYAVAENPDGNFEPVAPHHAAQAVREITEAAADVPAIREARLLRNVARVYLAPENRGRSRQAVATYLATSLVTASRRIRDAREQNLIPPKGAPDEELDAALVALAGGDA